MDHGMYCQSQLLLSINGDSCGFFQGKRVLRQGVLISPLIFVMAINYFSRPMKKLCKKEEFQFHYRCRQLRLTHLIFADDLMLFSKGDVQSVVLLVRTLKAFAQAFRLNAKPEKSAIQYGNVLEEVQQMITQITKINKGVSLLGILVCR